MKKPLFIGALAAVLAAVALQVSGCTRSGGGGGGGGSAEDNDTNQNGDDTAPSDNGAAEGGDAAFGAGIYDASCVGCHGDPGMGNASYPTAPDLADHNADQIEATLTGGEHTGPSAEDLGLTPMNFEDLAAFLDTGDGNDGESDG